MKKTIAYLILLSLFACTHRVPPSDLYTSIRSQDDIDSMKYAYIKGGEDGVFSTAFDIDHGQMVVFNTDSISAYEYPDTAGPCCSDDIDFSDNAFNHSSSKIIDLSEGYNLPRMGGNATIGIPILKGAFASVMIDHMAIGRTALLSNTSGSNTAVGPLPLQNNTTVDNNTAYGAFSLQQNTTGNQDGPWGVGFKATDTFTHHDQEIIGRSVVMTLPSSLFLPGVPQGQCLIFYPAAYKAGKLCAVGFFLPGDGQQQTKDITEVNQESLPRMIANNPKWTPFSILPNKDTLWHVIVTIHSAAKSAYRSQLDQIIPYVLDKTGLKYDPHHVWVSGFSGGGSGTWASIMIDTALTRRIKLVLPMANGGYDDKLATLKGNLIQACLDSVWFFPWIGNQDPGYNQNGWFAYMSLLEGYALPDHLHPHVIPGIHDSLVWDAPFKLRTTWDSIGIAGYIAPAPVTPNVKARLILDSVGIRYPTTWINVWDSSQNSQGGSWDILSGPNRPIITGLTPGHAIYSGLIPGAYTVGIHVYGANGSEDSARATILVYGPPACPPPVVCPVCPPQRSIKTVNCVLIGGIWQFQFIYTDGQSF